MKIKTIGRGGGVLTDTWIRTSDLSTVKASIHSPTQSWNSISCHGKTSGANQWHHFKTGSSGPLHWFLAATDRISRLNQKVDGGLEGGAWLARPRSTAQPRALSSIAVFHYHQVNDSCTGFVYGVVLVIASGMHLESESEKRATKKRWFSHS